MPLKQDIKPNADGSGGFFTGEDKELEFEAFQEDGKTPDDVSLYALEWVMRKKVTDPDPPSLRKTSGAGITVTGTYNVDPNLNTQRIIVTIAADDTAALPPYEYQHSLKRTDSGSRTILAFGQCVLLAATARG